MANKWYSYIVRENAYGVASRLITFAAGLVFTVVFPNLMGREEYGSLSLVIAAATFFLLFADFGVGNSLARFVPEGVKKGNAGAYISLLTKAKLGFVALATCAMFFGADTLASAVFLSPGIATGLRAAAAFLACSAVFGFVDDLLSSLKRNRESLIMNSAFHAGRLVLPLLFFLLLGHEYVWILLGISIAYVLPLLWGTRVLNSMKEVHVRGKTPPDLHALVPYVLMGALWLAAGTVVPSADTLIAGMFFPASAVAGYRIAWLWATSVVFLLPFSSRIMTSMHAYEDSERSKRILNTSLRYSFAFIFLLVLGTLAVADRFLDIIYQGRYTDAFPLLGILSLLTVEITLTSIAAPYFWGKGDGRTPSAIYVGYALLLVILAYGAAALGFGLVGIAIGVMIARVSGGVVMLALMLARSKVALPPSFVYKPALSAAVTLACVYLVRSGFGPGIIPSLALGVLTVAGYGALMLIWKGISLRDTLNIVKSAA